MNWEIVASTGEWAGAIAVVASLLYLTRQIHISNLQSQAAARYSYLDAYGMANATIATSKESASVFERGLEGGELVEGERLQFIVMLGQLLNTWGVMYDLHQEGQLPESQWFVVRTDIKASFSTEGGKRFWEKIGRLNVSPEFAKWVEELLKNTEPTYSMLEDKANH
ncbi:MAG: hypothetical protein ABJ013_05175 [Halioglobus sp.]